MAINASVALSLSLSPPRFVSSLSFPFLSFALGVWMVWMVWGTSAAAAAASASGWVRCLVFSGSVWFSG